jgi:hypothetical protein
MLVYRMAFILNYSTFNDFCQKNRHSLIKYTKSVVSVIKLYWKLMLNNF